MKNSKRDHKDLTPRLHALKMSIYDSAGLIWTFFCMQVAPRDPRRALGLVARTLPGARLPSPPRPVKHPRDDSVADKHEGRPAIKRPKTEGLKPKRTIVVPG